MITKNLVKFAKIFILSIGFGSLAFAQVADHKPQPNDNHKSGVAMLGNKLKVNGKHEVHSFNGHKVLAHVENGKIKGMSVQPNQAGQAKIKKYKSKTMPKTAENSFVFGDVAEMTDGDLMNTDYYIYYGYAVYDIFGFVYIYWYPAYLVLDPFDYADEYYFPAAI